MGGYASVGGEALEGALVVAAEDFGVEPFLVAEVIVDGGEVGAGFLADFADGGAAEAGLGEGLGGDGEQVFAGGGAVGGFGGWRGG